MCARRGRVSHVYDCVPVPVRAGAHRYSWLLAFDHRNILPIIGAVFHEGSIALVLTGTGTCVLCVCVCVCVCTCTVVRFKTVHLP